MWDYKSLNKLNKLRIKIKQLAGLPIEKISKEVPAI
jgi:hypothetical protein